MVSRGEESIWGVRVVLGFGKVRVAHAVRVGRVVER